MKHERRSPKCPLTRGLASLIACWVLVESGASPRLGSFREYQGEGRVKTGAPGNRGFQVILPHTSLRLGPRAYLEQTLESPQTSLWAAHGAETALQGGEEEEHHCVFSTVGRREETRGPGLCLTVPRVPPASRGAGGSDSDSREATLPFSEASSKGAPVTPHWGSWVCVCSPNPQGGPLRTAAGLPQPAVPTPSPAQQSGFSVSHLGPRGPIRKLFLWVR